MTTIGSLLKEKLMQAFTRETYPTDARGTMRVLEQERKEKEKLAQAEAKGDVSLWKKEENRLDKELASEGKRLFRLLRNIRLITHTQLMYLRIIASEVHDDKTLSDRDRQAVLERIAAYRKELGKLVNTIFREETSFESINLSAKNLLQISSLARELFFETKMGGRAARRATSLEKKLASNARKGGWVLSDNGKKYLKRFEAMFNEELERMTKEAESIILLLRDEESAIKSQIEHIRKLVHDEGFPPDIGKETEDIYRRELETFHRQLQEEIAKKRIELSDVERAA
ncbi:TPA: hypothetical protein HA251_07410 [Candidatus Woesearchaeota archaeon]|nr:hypothetical protein [Candidatus Woesearchaeota archaeon]